VLEAFQKSGIKPDWMIMEVLPVLPPELRPAGSARRRPFRDLGPERPLSPGHQPQNRLKRLLELKAPRDHRAQ